MFASKRDLNEVFDRLRKVENIQIADKEHEKNIEFQLEDFKEDFKKHDKEEMKKYDKIQSSLDILQRDRNYMIGGLIIYEILHKLGYISL